MSPKNDHSSCLVSEWTWTRTKENSCLENADHCMRTYIRDIHTHQKATDDDGLAAKLCSGESKQAHTETLTWNSKRNEKASNPLQNASCRSGRKTDEKNKLTVKGSGNL